MEVRQVEHIYRIFDDAKLPGLLKSLLAALDRLIGRFGHPHFYTVDNREFCGYRLLEDDGKLWFECEGEGADWSEAKGGSP